MVPEEGCWALPKGTDGPTCSRPVVGAIQEPDGDYTWLCEEHYTAHLDYLARLGVPLD